MALPYRADHIGSFLRPKQLLEARERGVSHDELKAIEDREILRVLAKQKELGFGIFTDGELRRAHFMSDLTDAVDGFDMGTESQRRFVAGAVATAAAKVMGVVTGKIKQHKHLTADELPFMKEHAPGPIKMTLPSATQFPANAYKKGISDKVYPTMSDFLPTSPRSLPTKRKALAEQGVGLHPDRRAALQLLRRSEVARLAQERVRPRSRTSCSTKRSPPITPPSAPRGGRA